MLEIVYQIGKRIYFLLKWMSYLEKNI